VKTGVNQHPTIMRKQILSLFCLTGFALIYSVARVVADPAEDADRRFLNNLEHGKAQQAAPAAVIPAARPAPSTAKGVPYDTSTVSSSQSSAVAPKSTNSEKTAKRSHKQQPAPVAQTQPAHTPTVAFGGQTDKPTEADNSPQRVRKHSALDQSAEVAEAAPGTAPAPAPADTVVERRVTIVRTPDTDDDHDRDQDDHEHHHHFFHRLFGHLFNNQHPEDW
jgi:hypothetical protein